MIFYHARSLIRLATELHSQQWIKILIREYNFTVNVITVINITIHKAFTSNDLVNKLFMAKMSLEKNINIFNGLIFVKAYAKKSVQTESKGKT